MLVNKRASPKRSPSIQVRRNRLVKNQIYQTTPADNPFKEISFFDSPRDIPYLKLLCILTQDPTSGWRLQLHQNGHLDNCIAIAETLLSRNGALSEGHNYAAAFVANVFAIIDASGDETHPLFNIVRMYLRRPLVLRAWKYIFDTLAEEDWITLSHEGYLDHLPSLVTYARKQSNDGDESLIALVEQVCHKVDEEKQQHGQGDAQHGSQEISALGSQIRRALLDASLTDV